MNRISIKELQAKAGSYLVIEAFWALVHIGMTTLFASNISIENPWIAVILHGVHAYVFYKVVVTAAHYGYLNAVINVQKEIEKSMPLKQKNRKGEYRDEEGNR